MDVRELINVKTEDQLMQEAIETLKSSGSKITNFNVGGIFRSLLALFFKALSGLYLLIGKVMSQAYIHSAENVWLDINVADVGEMRHIATYTEGNVVFTRTSLEDTNITIPANTMLKTTPDTRGKQLVFLTKETKILTSGYTEVVVPVIAEFEGSQYNVGIGQITNISTHISDVSATNKADWLTRAGTDTETDDSLKQRAMLKWDQLSGYTADFYKSLVLGINGVSQVIINDQHPRGQGTIDIIITSVNGIPTQDFVKEVQTYIETNKYICDDVLVKVPEIIAIDVSMNIYAHPTQGVLDLIKSEAESIVNIMFVQSNERPEITRLTYGTSKVFMSVFISNIMKIENVLNVSLISPMSDIPLNIGQIPVLRNLAINVERA